MNRGDIVYKSVSQPPLKTIVFLEWVRGSAAVMVALTHLLAQELPDFDYFIRHYVDPGRIGVVAFFLVSGYIIPITLRNQEIRAFLIRRLWRLYPIYIIALTVYLALAYWDSPWTSPSWWIEVFANYTMLQDLIGFAALLGPAWTLSIEWVFYAQQIGAKWLKRLDRGWLLGYLWLFLYLALCVGERVLGRDLPTTLPLLLSVSCLGHVWSLAANRDVSTRRLLELLVASVVIVPAGAYVGVDSGHLWPPLDYSLSYLAGLAWFAIAFALRRRSGGSLLVWFGGVSYALYLLHPLVRETVYLFVDGPLWMIVGLNAIFVPVIAWLGHKYVEVPFNMVGRRLTPRREPRPVSVVGASGL